MTYLPPPTMSETEPRAASAAPIGIRATAALAFATAAIFILTGILFAAAPGVLEPLGFREEPEAWRRLLGLTFFAGVGFILAHVGYGLWSFRRYGRSFAMAFAGAGLVACAERLYNGSTNYLGVGLAVLACLAVLGYFSIRRVRAVFGLTVFLMLTTSL